MSFCLRIEGGAGDSSGVHRGSVSAIVARPLDGIEGVGLDGGDRNLPVLVGSVHTEMPRQEPCNSSNAWKNSMVRARLLDLWKVCDPVEVPQLAMPLDVSKVGGE